MYFAGKLYRGCRVTKLDAAHIDAFASPNAVPLAEMGTGIVINWGAMYEEGCGGGKKGREIIRERER